MVAKGTMETSAKVQKVSLDMLLLAVTVLPASSAAAAAAASAPAAAHLA